MQFSKSCCTKILKVTHEILGGAFLLMSEIEFTTSLEVNEYS